MFDQLLFIYLFLDTLEIQKVGLYLRCLNYMLSLMELTILITSWFHGAVN